MTKKEIKDLESASTAAFNVMQHVIRASEPERIKNPAAVALGRLGASKGGKARAEKLSPERKHKIAIQAAQARWKTSR